jgi:hypothetical protein
MYTYIRAVEVWEFVSLLDFVETIKGVPKWMLLRCNWKSDEIPMKTNHQVVSLELLRALIQR